MNKRVQLSYHQGDELPWRCVLLANGKAYRRGASSTPESAIDAAANLGRRRK